MQAPAFISKLRDLRGSPPDEHTFNPTGLVFKNTFENSEGTSPNDSPKGITGSSKNITTVVFQKKLFHERVLKELSDAQVKIDKEFPPDTADSMTQKITHFLVTQRGKYKSLHDAKKVILELSWIFFAKNDSEEAQKLNKDLKERFILINQSKIRFEKLHAVFLKFLTKNKLTTEWTQELNSKFGLIASSLYPETFLSVFQDREIKNKTRKIFLWAVGGNSIYSILEGIVCGNIYPSLLRPINSFSFSDWKLKRLMQLGHFKWREKISDTYHIDNADTDQVRRSYYVYDQIIQTDININGVAILGQNVDDYLKHLFQTLVDSGYAKEIGESIENFKKDQETPFHKILRASTASSLSFCEMTLRTVFPELFSGRIFGLAKKKETKAPCHFYVKSSENFSAERVLVYTLYQKKTVQDWALTDAKAIGEIQIIWTLIWDESDKQKRWNGSLKLDKITFFDVDPLIKKEAIDIMWDGLADCRDPELMRPSSSRAQSLTYHPPLATPQADPGL